MIDNLWDYSPNPSLWGAIFYVFLVFFFFFLLICLYVDLPSPINIQQFITLPWDYFLYFNKKDIWSFVIPGTLYIILWSGKVIFRMSQKFLNHKCMYIRRSTYHYVGTEIFVQQPVVLSSLCIQKTSAFCKKYIFAVNSL